MDLLQSAELEGCRRAGLCRRLERRLGACLRAAVRAHDCRMRLGSVDATWSLVFGPTGVHEAVS